MTNNEPVRSQRRPGWNDALPYAAWAIALVSTVGSLFFSEVMGLAPCVLC